jgi:sodium-dependent dicarboxylate transporter 2/3/5
MAIGGPVALVFLPIAWMLDTRVLYPIRITNIEGGRELIAGELARLGPMHRGERVTLTVFFATAGLWIFRPLIVTWPPLAGLSDGGIAMLAALALFVIPAETRPPTFTLDWPTAVKLPWGVLILFGGGLSLAAAVQANGVAEFFGAQATALGGLPPIFFVLAVTSAVIFLTELTSNTATTATLLPVLAGLAPGIGMHPDYLIFPATIAASCAFMMPVGTPPNAIVFGSGYVTIPEMCKAGLWLNLVGIVIITGMMYALVIPLLGLGR